MTQSPNYSSSQNYLTNVGAFTNSASYYGTFDQSGNVWEWTDLTGVASEFRVLRGGNYGNDASNASSTGRFEDYPSTDDPGSGFRLVNALSGPAGVPEIDPAGLGSVLALVGGAFGLLERRRKRA